MMSPGFTFSGSPVLHLFCTSDFIAAAITQLLNGNKIYFTGGQW